MSDRDYAAEYAAEDALFLSLIEQVGKRLQKLADEGVITFIQSEIDKNKGSHQFFVAYSDNAKRDFFIEISNTALNGPSIRIPTGGFSQLMQLNSNFEDRGIPVRQKFSISAGNLPSDTLRATSKNVSAYLDKVEDSIRSCKLAPAMA